ncbi:MAG: hypothetical protein KDA96_16570, partial [Planctomycetaceae bacterium]|nr:hypothetical protein [Planctomycetaceae bacterium]
RLLLIALAFQICLGIAAFATRLGLASLGLVAVAGSLSQTVSCSLHTVGGILLLSAAIVASASVIHLFRLGSLTGLRTELVFSSVRGDGGAA